MDAEAWDERYAASELVWSAGPNQFVEAACADLEPGRALDLAAGEGRNAIWLAQRGWNATAVDFSAVALEKGRRLAAEVNRQRPDPARHRIEWVVADATTWERPDSYDLVVIAYLQVPESARRKAVRHGFASLRPEGTFFLVAHDTTNLTEGTGGPQDTDVLMTAKDVLADLAGEPFEVVRAERVAREVTAADDHGGEERRTAWDCLVHLTRR